MKGLMTGEDDAATFEFFLLDLVREITKNHASPFSARAVGVWCFACPEVCLQIKQRNLVLANQTSELIPKHNQLLCCRGLPMPFEQWSYNWKIYRILRRLAKQRVRLVLQPGNVWVIENAVTDNGETDALLKTCYIRGWVEPLENSVPKGKLQADGSLPKGPIFQEEGPVWKLTDSGWSAINRSHQLAILGVLVSLVGVLIAVST